MTNSAVNRPSFETDRQLIEFERDSPDVSCLWFNVNAKLSVDFSYQKYIIMGFCWYLIASVEESVLDTFWYVGEFGLGDKLCNNDETPNRKSLVAFSTAGGVITLEKGLLTNV
jgi:hypothetical protein